MQSLEEEHCSRKPCPMCSVATAPMMPVVVGSTVPAAYNEEIQESQGVPTIELLSSFASNLNDILASGYHLWQNLHTGEFQLSHQKSLEGCVKPRQWPAKSAPTRELRSRARAQRKCKRSGFKKRIVWTPKLKQSFEEGLNRLGKTAKPLEILRWLRKDGCGNLTRQQVANYLQRRRAKYTQSEEEASKAQLSMS